MRRYISVDQAIILHKYLISEFGGAKGLRSISALESALMRPQSGYYNDIIEEATALMESLAINHPFVDGNKRISFFVTDVFLRLNGYFIDCDSESAYQFFMNLFETNLFKYDKLHPWLMKHTKSL